MYQPPRLLPVGEKWQPSLLKVEALNFLMKFDTPLAITECCLLVF